MRVPLVRVAVLVALVATPPIAAAQQSTGRSNRPPAQSSPMREIQGFHVALVVGETGRGQSSTENLTEAAARALKDMGEFLPYKSYRVLDAQWSSCCSGSESRVSGRLQGAIAVPGSNGATNLVHRPYAFTIIARASGAGIQTRFVLTAQDGAGAGHSSDERAELERVLKNTLDDAETLELRVNEARRRMEVGIASTLEVREALDKLTKARREIEGLRAHIERLEAGGESGIMDSSFTMDAGETVVVGTSKLGGDRALIAVVTAVPKGTK